MRKSVPHSSAQVHLFSMGGRQFALDVGTSSGFCVDEAAARALGALAGAAAPESGLEEAVQEQRAWRESGCFPPVPPPLGAPQSATQRVVELSATHRCTLRCAYCYSGHDEGTRQTPLDASREVIDAAVRWATTAFAEDCPRVHITTGVTGEGMLRTDLYGYVCEQAERAAEAILERLEEARRRRARDGRPLSILLTDLDGFKRVNDVHGHAAGDRALREFARRICAAVRPYDVTGRLGGDEFLVVLPDATEFQALAVGERVRSAMSATGFDLGAAGLYRLTSSWGVGQVEDGLTVAEALAQADQALYEAKARGGNRVCTPPTATILLAKAG